jgi:rhodanese-related sulfurtransferase
MRQWATITSFVVLVCLILVTGSDAQDNLQERRFAEIAIPLQKQTVLGLYVTSKEAYAMWQKNFGEIKILDCRTPEEYVMVGHPPMAHNVPVRFFTYNFDFAKNNYVMKENPDFIPEVKNRLKVTDTVLVMCRSGSRSAASVNKLAEAGFKKVYNVIDGFEGDPIKDPESSFDGKYLKNGWKNSGAPWTYALDPKLVYAPHQEMSPPAGPSR